MKTLDLFAGCGGMSLGFQNAGFEIIAAFDHWKPAVNVYKKNFPHSIYDLDLGENLNLLQYISEKPEIIIGGPPCQDFSSAGKRDENLGRANLTVSFAKIVAAIKPQWFVMENVERITRSQSLKLAKHLLCERGYSFTEQILNASYCGVPQDRKRYFLIGELEGKENALQNLLVSKQSKNPMTIHDYLGNSLGIEHYYRHPRSYQRRGIFSIYEPSPTIRGVNRPIPATYKPHPGDTAPVTDKIRPLTTKERSYIQTFPRDFIFEGSKSDIEQMIGNAVPVKLAEYVAQCILEYVPQKDMLPLDQQVQLALL